MLMLIQPNGTINYEKATTCSRSSARSSKWGFPSSRVVHPTVLWYVICQLRLLQVLCAIFSEYFFALVRALTAKVFSQSRGWVFGCNRDVLLYSGTYCTAKVSLHPHTTRLSHGGDSRIGGMRECCTMRSKRSARGWTFLHD